MSETAKSLPWDRYMRTALAVFLSLIAALGLITGNCQVIIPAAAGTALTL